MLLCAACCAVHKHPECPRLKSGGYFDFFVFDEQIDDAGSDEVHPEAHVAYSYPQTTCKVQQPDTTCSMQETTSEGLCRLLVRSKPRLPVNMPAQDKGGLQEKDTFAINIAVRWERCGVNALSLHAQVPCQK